MASIGGNQSNPHLLANTIIPVYLTPLSDSGQDRRTTRSPSHPMRVRVELADGFISLRFDEMPWQETRAVRNAARIPIRGISGNPLCGKSRSRCGAVLVRACSLFCDSTRLTVSLRLLKENTRKPCGTDYMHIYLRSIKTR